MKPELISIPIIISLVVPAAGWWIERILCGKLQKQAQADAAMIDLPLPSAGQHFQQRLQPLQVALRVRTALSLLVPVLAAAAWLLASGLDLDSLDAAAVAIMVVPVLVVEGWLIAGAFWIRSQRHSALSGYRARQATAQALAPFEQDGDFVCHDFLWEDMRIDHLLVGAKGIFAIQTHAGAVDPESEGGLVPMVTYDGRGIYFPRRGDGGTLASAHAAEEWLSSWLSEGLKTPVAPRAIVSMPGWRVKRISSEGIPVVNPRQFQSLFAHIPARPLSPRQIQIVIELIKTAYG